jgi:ABC-2 type transport system permease protein
MAYDRAKIYEQAQKAIKENNLFFIESSYQYAFSFSKSTLEDAKALVQNGERYGLLHIPSIDLSKPSGFVFYSMQSPSMVIITFVEASLKRRIE